MPSVRDAVTLFLALWLIARDAPVTDHTAAWMSLDGRGAVVWETGRWLGLVGPWERSWAETPPLRGGAGLIADHRFDLTRLRDRAHPAPCRMPPN